MGLGSPPSWQCDFDYLFHEMSCSSLAAFNIFSLSFGFNHLTINCLSVGLLEFILLVVHGVPWTCVFMYFLRFGKLLDSISSKNFSASFFVYLLLGLL